MSIIWQEKSEMFIVITCNVLVLQSVSIYYQIELLRI